MGISGCHFVSPLWEFLFVTLSVPCGNFCLSLCQSLVGISVCHFVSLLWEFLFDTLSVRCGNFWLQFWLRLQQLQEQHYPVLAAHSLPHDLNSVENTVAPAVWDVFSKRPSVLRPVCSELIPSSLEKT